MRILLFGEFSGLYKNLQQGLSKIGHEVVTVSFGDGYRKINSDIVFSSKIPGIIGKFHSKLKFLRFLRTAKNYDVVQIINPFAFYFKFTPFLFSVIIFKYIKKNNKKLFISGAGDDAYFWTFGRARLRYAPFEDFLKYDIKKKNYFMEEEKSLSFNSRVLEISNGIIPIMYEYRISYAHELKCLKSIAIPLDLTDIKFEENIVGDKLVVFHGLSRYGFKGTRHVEEAFAYLREKYPDKLELIISGGMPLEKYLRVMRRTNVIIDQIYSHSIGVNGVLALAMGKVVIGGAEPEALMEFGLNQSPVINVKPNTESLIQCIEDIISRQSEISDMGRKGREYVEAQHDAIIVAKQYVSTWLEN